MAQMEASFGNVTAYGHSLLRFCASPGRLENLRGCGGGGGAQETERTLPLGSELAQVVEDVDHITDAARRLLDLGRQVDAGHGYNLQRSPFP